MTTDHDHLLAQAEIIGTSAANYPAGTRVISINELDTLLRTITDSRSARQRDLNE